MPSDQALDPAAILATLGVNDVRAMTPVQGGTDTSIWRVEHGSMTSALRVFRVEQLATYKRELAAMEAASQAQVAVPEVRAAGIWQERPALLLSWCSGATLWDVLQKQPLSILSIGRMFGRAQAQLHRAAPAAELQGQGSTWIDWPGPDEQLHSALRRLARPAPVLLHLDYHPLNVLSDGRQITAILDWANARAGDPRADVARTYTILMVEPYTPEGQPLLITIMRRLLAISWRQGYEQVAGPLADMPWFYTWAGSVMQRDLARRVENPQSWWQPRHMEQVRRWTERWREWAERG
jgi:aminoglycoside phosphotransferase (APT) family kinase protein